MALLASPETIYLPDSELSSRPFVPYIPEDAVDARIDALAQQICEDYGDREILMISIAVGGSFFSVPLARAMRRCNPSIRLSHSTVRLSSYGQQTTSSGVVRELSVLNELLGGRHLLAADEVIDTGTTMAWFKKRLAYGDQQDDGPSIPPASIAIAGLVDKATVHNGRVTVNYAGFETPDYWFVGCGMDHEGLGRELPAVYRSATPNDPQTSAPYTIPATISPFAGQQAA